MSKIVTVRRPHTGDIMTCTIKTMINFHVFLEEYLLGRFGVQIGDISQVQQDTDEPDFPARSIVPYTVDASRQLWPLCGGCAYVLVVDGDP
jgi:hypothetical protein